MTQYSLHYVGSRVYRPDVFRWEAKKKGVNRALPAHYAKQLAFGQPVLVAIWNHPLCERVAGEKPTKEGTANVFGYFRVTGIHIEAPAEVQKWINERLRIVSVGEGPNEAVDRACGSYAIGPAIYVEDTVAEIVILAEEAEKVCWGVRPKLFVAGAFFDMDPPLSLEPAKFTRTLLNVNVDGWEPNWFSGDKPSNANPKAVVRFLMDYAMRRYVKKAERERMFANVAKDVIP